MSFNLQSTNFASAKLNKLNKQAFESFAKQDYEKTINLFLEIAKVDPLNSILWMNLGIVYYLIRNFLKAAESFHLAYIYDNKIIEAKFNYAIALIAMEQFPKAIKELEAALKIKPEEQKGRIELARLYWLQGDSQQALNNFHKVLMKNFYNFEAVLGAAEIYFKTNQHQKAIEYFERAFKLQPDNIFVLYHLGGLYGDQQKYDLATEKLEKILSLKPDFQEALFLLAKIDNLTGKLDDAILKLEQLNQRYPNNYEVLLEYGIAVGNKEEYVKAITIFENVLKIQPDSIEAWNLLAKCYAQIGDMEKAHNCELQGKSQ